MSYIDTGDVYTFGLNDHGQLGIGKAEGKQRQGHERCNTALPQLVDFFEDSKGNYDHGQGVSPIEVSVVNVACGHSHTVVLDGIELLIIIFVFLFCRWCLILCRRADADMYYLFSCPLLYLYLYPSFIMLL